MKYPVLSLMHVYAVTEDLENRRRCQALTLDFVVNLQIPAVRPIVSGYVPCIDV